MLGPEMGNYVVVATSEMDEKTKDNQSPSVVIAVENIREAMKKIEEVGGKILGGMKPGEPDTIPGVGLYISFIDTEGNRVGVLQPLGM